MEKIQTCRDRRPRLSETSYFYSGQTRASVPTLRHYLGLEIPILTNYH
ncbi:hypothetical protein HMPREF0973_02913 [Prevotella veroralis F0319]|uniref:Uncharacterized protein n=1 Tax=Prevotella veroralis F0319 TaxID=649761 RepID=C9MTD9_9BACT|nr:hypothetical protein HMPREF0973_02913 [Prevotella veroralis F0319]